MVAAPTRRARLTPSNQRPWNPIAPARPLPRRRSGACMAASGAPVDACGASVARAVATASSDRGSRRQCPARGSLSGTPLVVSRVADAFSDCGGDLRLHVGRGGGATRDAARAAARSSRLAGRAGSVWQALALRAWPAGRHCCSRLAVRRTRVRCDASCMAPRKVQAACEDEASRPCFRRARTRKPRRYRSSGALSPRSARALPRAHARVRPDEHRAPS